MPFPPSEVPRKRLHTRRVTYEGWQREDGLFDIEARLVDVKDHDYALASGVRPRGAPIHEMSVRVTIGSDFVVRALEAAADAVPYADGCELIAPAYAQLVGLNLMDGYRAALYERMGGDQWLQPPHRAPGVPADGRGADVREPASGEFARRRQAVPARPVPRARAHHRDRAALLPQVVPGRRVRVARDACPAPDPIIRAGAAAPAARAARCHSRLETK